MATTRSERDLWIDLVMAALRGYERPDNVEKEEDLVDSMVSVATEFADAVLDELDDRYTAAGKRKRRGRRARDEEEAEEDLEEEEEDD